MERFECVDDHTLSCYVENNVEPAADEPEKIELATYDPEEEWVKEYIEQFGCEPSFF